MCGAKRGENAGGWRKLRTEKNRELYINILIATLVIGFTVYIVLTFILAVLQLNDQLVPRSKHALSLLQKQIL
jgi:hypothetical protein